MRHCCEYFTWICPLNSNKHLMMYLSSSSSLPFYTWGNHALERLSKLPQVMQVIKQRNWEISLSDSEGLLSEWSILGGWRVCVAELVGTRVAFVSLHSPGLHAFRWGHMTNLGQRNVSRRYLYTFWTQSMNSLLHNSPASFPLHGWPRS